MAQLAILQNPSQTTFPALKVICATSFIEKFRGLMLKKSISVNEGLLFVENVESRLNTAIHMLFMNFDIGVVWLNSSKVVVDKTYAKRWRPYYASRFPARYTLEIHPNLLPLFSIGDQITLSFEK